MSPLTTHVEAFRTDAGPKGSVHVRSDGELSLKFKRGGVAEGEGQGADALLAMCLGVDGEAIDVLVCDRDSLFEVLNRAQMAIEIALEGYHTTP
jgi:hypothetical protein